MARKKKDEKLDQELSLEEAQNIIKRLAHPKHVNQEDKLLREAAAVVLKETQPEFEFGEEEDESVDIGTASADQTTSELTKSPGFFEQMGAQVSNLGAAGCIALASAAYFQVDTVVEETRTVATVAEEKWEEVKFEHPNINWDDPLAGFTTIIGVGDIEIDLEPPEPKDPQPSTSEEPNAVTKDEESESSEEASEAPEETVEETSEEPEEEQEEKPKKKKKGLFGLFGGDDDEEEAEEEESEDDNKEETNESEEEPREDEESEETKDESESEEPVEESNEPEPEAEEEQVEEKPKKKSGGLFSSLFGGGDDESEEPEENGEEPQQDDTIPDEQAEETADTESEAEATDGEVGSGESTAEPVESTNTAESDGVKKSSGGGLLSLFGFNSSEEEVVNESEVSTDEEPEIQIEVTDSGAETPPNSEGPTFEINEVEVVDVESGEKVEINLNDMSEIEIDILSDAFDNGEVEINNLNINDAIEETVEEETIKKIITPNDGRVVSPHTSINDIFGPGFLGPNAPGSLSGSESDATPI